MKKLMNSSLKCLVAFGLFLVSVNLQASAVHSLKIEKDAEGKVLKLQIETKLSDQFQVRIIDASSIVLHKETITVKKRMMKKYVLEQLPEGEYSFEIEGTQSKIIQPIQISVTDLELDETQRREVFKPVVRLKNNNLDINLLILENSKVQLELFNTDYEKVYYKQFKNFGPVFGKRLDLSQITKGKYILKLKTGDEVYNEVINLK